jgi:hypothetical protein
MKCEYEELVKIYWEEKTHLLTYNLFQCQLCLPQTPHWLAWDQTWASKVNNDEIILTWDVSHVTKNWQKLNNVEVHICTLHTHTEHYQWDDIKGEEMAAKCCKRGLCEKLTN